MTDDVLDKSDPGSWQRHFDKQPKLSDSRPVEAIEWTPERSRDGVRKERMRG